MNSADWPEIERLYLEASSLDRGQQISLLESCGNSSIRSEVESLLAADRTMGSFLEQPPSQLAADLISRQPGQLKPQQIIAGYRVVSLIAAGGMGEVYRVESLESQETIALKLLRRHFISDPAATDRFEREAAAVSALSHPNIVKVFEFGEAESGHFIALEWVEGQTWRELILSSPAIEDALEYARQGAQALAAAHGAGIIHRDIKPDNLMLSKAGLVKVLDFGLARKLGGEVVDVEMAGASGTISGTLSGTLPYMPPEVLLGERASSASDIFSFGSVVYELLTGVHPFAGETPLDVFEAIESCKPKLPSSLRAGLSESIDALLLSMLDRNPYNRPNSEQVAASLY